MKKLFLFLFIAIIGGAIYLVGTTSVDTPHISTPSGHAAPAERVISLCKPIPMVVMGLDASDRRLVGVHPGAKVGMKSNVLNRYFPNFQNLPDNVCTQGFAPNMEEIMRLKPDMVIIWSRFTEAIAQMQGFGLNVTGLHFDGSDQNDREIVNIIAKTIGREAMADSIMKERDSTFRQMKAISDNIPIENRPKVLFLYNYETLNVGGEKCYEHFCINLGGGHNLGVGLGVGRSVNLEQILEWNPDIILVGGWLNNTDPADIFQNPMLADLNAVRNRRVYKVPVWGSNESVLIWKWTAEMIQPDLFDFNLREEIHSAYARRYKINLTEADIDEVLFYMANAASWQYTNFKSKQ